MDQQLFNLVFHLELHLYIYVKEERNILTYLNI